MKSASKSSTERQRDKWKIEECQYKQQEYQQDSDKKWK